MKNDRFVIVIDPRYNKNITEEKLKKILEDNWGPDSFHLITVPENVKYTLTARTLLKG